MNGTDPGLPIPNPWRKDAPLVEEVKAAVLAIRAENEWGPRKRYPGLVFRASELGDLVNALDKKGEAAGCARKVFYGFHEDKFPRAALTAEQVLNFAKGDDAEAAMEEYLRKNGLYVESQARFGAWAPCKGTDGNGLPQFCSDPAAPTCGVSGNVHGDHRFPDRSGGTVRGKADFIIKHPKHGNIPLEWKSCSTYVFDMVLKDGPKVENSLQALFYGNEAGTTHCAVGYTNKETGDIAIFVATVQPDLMAHVFEIAKERRRQILAGEVPAAPVGARPAQYDENRRSGFKKMPPEPYYDRAWPCYTYAAKKGIPMPCAFYEVCHGPLPEKPGKAPAKRAGNPVLAKRRKNAPASYDFK